MTEKKQANTPPSYELGTACPESDATWSDYKFLISNENLKTFTYQLFGVLIFSTLMVLAWVIMANFYYARETILVISIICPFLFCFIISKVINTQTWLWAPLLGIVCVAMINETSGIFGGNGLKEISLSIYVFLLTCISAYLQFNFNWNAYKEKLGFTNALFLVIALTLILLGLALFKNEYLLFIAAFLPFLSKKQASLFSIPAHSIFLIAIIGFNNGETFVSAVIIVYILILLQIAYIKSKAKLG